MPGDLDGDGAVAGSDLALLLAAWAQSSAAAGHLAADLSGDGVVDAADLAMLLASWGQGG
ncbi:MAG: dockerin type I domain-containing protein [bacterium]